MFIDVIAANGRVIFLAVGNQLAGVRALAVDDQMRWISIFRLDDLDALAGGQGLAVHQDQVGRAVDLDAVAVGQGLADHVPLAVLEGLGVRGNNHVFLAGVRAGLFHQPLIGIVPIHVGHGVHIRLRGYPHPRQQPDDHCQRQQEYRQGPCRMLHVYFLLQFVAAVARAACGFINQKHRNCPGTPAPAVSTGHPSRMAYSSSQQGARLRCPGPRRAVAGAERFLMGIMHLL